MAVPFHHNKPKKISQMIKHIKAGNLRVLFKKSFTKNKIMDDSTDGTRTGHFCPGCLWPFF